MLFRSEKVVGIEELFSATGELDLFADVGDMAGSRGKSLLRPGRAKTAKLCFSDRGLDLDNYFSQIKGGKSYATQLKAIVGISKNIGAVNSAILTEQESIYMPELTIGFADSSIKKYQFNREDIYFSTIFTEKKVLIINERIDRIRSMARKLSEDDLRYLSGGVFFPAVFQGKQALVFFGFAKEKEWDLKELIIRLSIY